jgi:3-dehydroquinate synthase
MAGASVEMYKLDVISSSLNYSVTVEKTFNAQDLPAQSYVMIDSSILLDLNNLEKEILVIQASEAGKTLETCERIISFLKDRGATRDSILIAIGGGNIQDLATLSASLYMRGITWQYYPTTSTAMLDSCIGGKSSINVGVSKNLIGNFYPPEKIRCCTDFLSTLSKIDLASGLIEAAKICFAKDSVTFDSFLKSLESSNQGGQRVDEGLIFLTLNAKKWFIEVDEFDKRERQLLNFGHTVGHALESATNFRISHGIAVGIGCLAEIQLGQSSNSKNKTNFINIIKFLLEPAKSILREEIQLIDYELFYSAFESDKKHSQSHFRVVTYSDHKLKLVDLKRDGAVIEGVFKDVMSILREI